MDSSQIQILDFDVFEDPPSPLFRGFLAKQPEALQFYAEGGWGPGALDTAAERALVLPREREALARELVRQQEQRQAVEAARSAARLADPQSVAVVTGQQACLFGGPLYVLYKALAAMLLARELEGRRGHPVIPVFWVASDDHDFAEVRSAAVLDEANRIRTLRYAPASEPSGQPASAILLDETITRQVEELGGVLPASHHRDDVLAAVTAAYRPGASVSGAFAELLSRLLPGLVVLDPAETALKRLMTSVMSREVTEDSPTSRLAAGLADRLRAAGYHEQVPVRPGFLNLFVVEDGQRRALASSDGTLEVRGVGRQLTRKEATESLARHPEAWSPGVLLRPLAQDLLLPTAAYIGGPAEIAYHAQIGPSYEHFGIPRPMLAPRPSVTLIEPAQARVLAAEDLTLTDLQADPEGRVARWAREAHPEIEEAFAAAHEATDKKLEAVQQLLGRLDPTLRAAADGARGRALHQINTLHEKAIRALKKRDQTRASRLRRTRDVLFPGGLFQERGLAWIGLLARRGPALVDELRDALDPWASGHQVLSL